MSNSRRDQRRRPRSGKKCPEAASGGCAYCRTGEYKDHDSRKMRYSKRSAIRSSIQED